MTHSERERRRATIVQLIRYHRTYGHSAKSGARLDQLRSELSQYPIDGILPDLPGPLLACCGQWWPVESIPLTTPCCGRSYLEEITRCP